MSDAPKKGQWELLELIGAYAAGELGPQEAREAERLLIENDDHRRLVESYSRMIVLLSVTGQESPGAPEAVINAAVRRAYVAAFFQQAEDFFGDIGRSYVNAFVYYLGLRPKTA